MEETDRGSLRATRAARRVPTRAVAAALLAGLLAGAAGCKPGDGATGVNPPADTRKADQAPSPGKPRQP